MRRSITWLLVLGVLGALLAPGAARAEDDGEIRVEQWLLLGPVPHPLPAFHGEEDRLELDELLRDLDFVDRDTRPRAGQTVRWFDGSEQVWSEAVAAKKGLVPLENPAAEEGLPALAMLASSFSLDRWAEIEVELDGTQARCAWVDGERVVDCGGEDGEDDLDGSVELAPGSHRLLVLTVHDPRQKGRWGVGVRIQPDDDESDNPPRLSSGADLPHEIDILDILDPASVNDVAVAPDGKRAALIYSRVVPGTSDSETWIELRHLPRGEVIESWRAGGAGSVAWSGDGRYVSWVGPADDGRAIYLYELKTGRRFPLLDREENLGSYLWSPTGKLIAYTTTVEHEEDDRGVKRVEGLMDRWAGYRDKQFLNWITVPDGVSRPITTGDLTTTPQAFSADGKRLLFTRLVEDFEERPYSYSELWEMDLENLETRRLRNFRWFNAASYSPDGSRLLIRAQPDEFGSAGVNVAPGAVPNSYDTQLFLWDPETDEVEAISKKFDPTVSAAQWSDHDGHIYLIGDDRDYRRLYRYDVETGSYTPLETDFDVVTQFALARSAPRAVAVGNGVWQPQGLAAVDLQASRSRRLPHPADDHFRSVLTGTSEDWDFEAASGRVIDGRIYLPPNFDPERRYPAIVYYYGGTVPVGRSFGGRYPKEWWATRGYVVYVMQPSGATGFGQAFSALHVNDWGKTSSDEIIEGTRRFLEAHPYVDPERVGCIGASYGGFMTMLLSTKTDIFAAAVAHAGISSISSYWGEGYWGYAYSSVATADSFPWNRPDLYVEQSPLFRADQHQVPILLTHGNADTNVPVGESDQFFVALKLLGKQVEYVQVDGQDHWILEHDKRVLWSRTILAWFDRHLKDQPDWWNELYP